MGMNERIGLQLIGIRDLLTTSQGMKDAFSEVAKMGYGMVSAGRGRLPAVINVQEVADLIHGLGMKTAHTNVPFETLMDEDGFEQTLEEQKIWDNEYIVIGSLPPCYRTSQEGYRTFVKGLNTLAKKLKDNGQTLLYHNHAQEFRRFADGVRGIDMIVFDSVPELGFQLDTHWIQSGGGDIYWWMRQVKGRLPILHCKDYMIDPDASITDLGLAPKLFAEVGEGNIDWVKVIRVGEEIGVKSYVVEQDETRRHPLESARISFENLDRAMAQA